MNADDTNQLRILCNDILAVCQRSERRRQRLSGFAFFAALSVSAAALSSIPAWSQAKSDQASTDRVNQIINNFSKPPPTRGRTRGVTRGAKLDASLVCEQAIGRATRSVRATKKDLAEVRDCIADLPKMDFKVNFEYNSDKIGLDARKILDELGIALENEQLGDATFIVAGHTDASGSRSYNMELSKRRAEAVRRYLMERFRIRGNQLVPIGYGFDSLAEPAAPRSEANRRVEVVRMN